MREYESIAGSFPKHFFHNDQQQAAADIRWQTLHQRCWIWVRYPALGDESTSRSQVHSLSTSSTTISSKQQPTFGGKRCTSVVEFGFVIQHWETGARVRVDRRFIPWALLPQRSTASSSRHSVANTVPALLNLGSLSSTGTPVREYESIAGSFPKHFFHNGQQQAAADIRWQTLHQRCWIWVRYPALEERCESTSRSQVHSLSTSSTTINRKQQPTFGGKRCTSVVEFGFVIQHWENGARVRVDRRFIL